MRRAIPLMLALWLFAAPACAAPSISALETERAVTIAASEQLEAALPELAGDVIYTSRALPEQYDAGTASVIELAEQTFEEMGTNGHTIAQTIPSVEEIFAGTRPVKASGAEDDLGALSQLTYMQDFKLESTGWRIVPREGLPDVIVATIDGGEVTRSARQEDFVIVQVDLTTGERYTLPMQAYDPETGVFVVEFPCVGPYMITLKM